MADNSIPAVTDANFEAEVLTASSTQPVLVDFWAEWCRPCHMLAPTVAEIAHDYAGKLKVTKLNVDEAMNSAGRYNIRGIPTLLVFKNGQVVEQIVGAVPKGADHQSSRTPRNHNSLSGLSGGGVASTAIYLPEIGTTGSTRRAAT